VGKITYFINLPVEVDYTYFKEEMMTESYPGSPPHIEVDGYDYPKPEVIEKIIEDNMANIEEACWMDNGYDPEWPEFDEGGWE